MALLDRNRFQLEIVGTGPEEAALRERARRLGLERQVRFTGWLDRAQVARRYRESDLFTLAPRAESVGTSFVEALASGLPVVGSHVGAIPDLIDHERNGLLVTPRHPRDLAQAIGGLAADARLCAEIGRRNRAQAEQKHSWDRVTSRYLTIYNGARRREPARRRVAEIPSSSW
jgi:glycosyltransferase involved in cell wall biosynthesis